MRRYLLYVIALLFVPTYCFALPAPPPGKQWKLTFEDNFNGTTLDTSKWSIGYGWGRTANFSNTYVESANVTVSNGVLILEAKKQQSHGYDYTAGYINTKNKFSQKYGYWEARIKTASGYGLWMAYWTKQNNENWPPEIDIVETMGAQHNDRAKMTVHYNKDAGAGATAKSGGAYSTPGFYSQYHTYGMLWDETGYKWYIDGVLRFSSSAGIDHMNRPDVDKFYTMIGLQIPYGGWLNPPDSSTQWGTDQTRMYVDYVRTYQLQPVPEPSSLALALPTILTAILARVRQR